MVTGVFVAIAIVASVAILSFKGITVRYDKHFTIEDKRGQHFSKEDLVKMEQDINKKPEKEVAPEVKNPESPMNKAIETLQDIFGPGLPEDDSKGGN